MVAGLGIILYSDVNHGVVALRLHVRTHSYTVVPLFRDHPTVLSSHGLPRGVVCDQGEVWSVGGANHTHMV